MLKVCSNCCETIDIETTNFDLHVIRCQKFNVYCKVCQTIILTNEYKEHQNLHILVECEQCGQEIENQFILDHKQTSCLYLELQCQQCNEKYYQLHEHHCFPKQTCPYCEEIFKGDVFEAHLNSCINGFKTEPCIRCHRRIQRNAIDQHLMACDPSVFVAEPTPPQPRPGPAASRRRRRVVP